MSEEAKSKEAGLREIVQTTFEKVKELAAGKESSRLFPTGIASPDLNVSYVGDATAPNVSLKIVANSPGSGSTDAQRASTEDDLEEGENFGVLFNSEGHHVIALIAEKDLQARVPQTMQNLQAILDAVGRTLLDAATFPDDIRDSHPETKPFHFVDIPFKNNGLANPPIPPGPNVLTKINDFTSALRNGTGDATVKADAVSWLIHLLGDIHQPLHCVTHISNQHPAPNGDRGGNLFKLTGTPRNLHSLWDSSVSVLRHISEPELATEIFQKHTRSSLERDLQVTSTEQWARSSYALAKTNAYDPLTENPAHPPKPSKAYLIKMESIGQKQAALAGYRLADRLVQLFP